MKNYLAGLLLILVTVSCTTKKENEPQVLDKDYASKPVGVINNGAYHIIDINNSQKWEANLKESFGLNEDVSFSKFEIVKTVTQGDVPEDCYLLLTHTSDGLSAIAVILQLKDDKFYFDVNTERKKPVGWAIMCKGSNAALGCMPAVVMHNNQKRLLCSSNDCEKVVSDVSL